MNNLALSYRDAGNLDLALPLFEETLNLCKAKLGPDHPTTLTSMNNIAMGYQDAGNLDLALPLFEETLKLCKVKLGPDHPNTLNTMNNLRAAYIEAGKTSEAAKLIQEQLALARKQLKPDSSELAGTLAATGMQMLVMKRYADAEPLLVECLILREKLSSGDKPTVALWQVANVKSMLGGALLGQKKYAEAEPLLLAGYEGLKKDEKAIPPQGKINIPNAIQRLAELYEATGKKDEAAKLIQEQLVIARKQLKPDSPQLAGMLAATGMQMLVMKRYADAEPLLRECLAIREKLATSEKPTVAPWQVANVKSMLGGALLGQKKYAEAEPLLLAGYEGLKKDEKAIPPQGKMNMPNAIQRLAELYEGTGKKDDAAKWRKELEAVPKSGKP